MKPVFLVIGAAWTLSLGAAYLIGHGSAPSSEAAAASESPRRSGTHSPASSKSDRGDSLALRNGRPIRSTAKGSTAVDVVTNRPPREAVVELARLTDPVERAKGFLALIDTLQPDQFREVVADFRALGITEQRRSEYGILLHAWAKTAPEEALDYTLKNTGTPFARQTVLASWAADDPEAAIAAAKQRHQGDGANPLLVGVIRGIAPNDLVRATAVLQDLPYSSERGDALQSMLPFVMQNGADVALQWTAGLADERLKSGAITFIMSDLSQHQPEVAAEILTTLDDNQAAMRVADEVAGSLARVSLERAITWSEGLQDDVRGEAVEGIIGPYASQDPQAASQWLESLADTDTNLDAAIRSFSRSSLNSDPQLAADWVGRINDEPRRTEAYMEVLFRWYRQDAAAAATWIQSTPNLPDKVRDLPEQMDRNRRQ